MRPSALLMPGLIAPGAPERSVLYKRITRSGDKQMPPISTNIVDQQGAELMRKWILSLPGRTIAQ